MIKKLFQLTILYACILGTVGYGIAWDSPESFKNNKALSSLLTREGFKFFDTLEQYSQHYNLNQQRIYYNEDINIYDNDDDCIQAGELGREHIISKKVGGFVLNVSRKNMPDGPIIVKKTIFVGPDAPVDAGSAFLKKYAIKKKIGEKRALDSQYLPLYIKHKDRYLTVNVIYDYIYSCKENAIVYEVTDYTQSVIKYIKSKARAKDLIK